MKCYECEERVDVDLMKGEILKRYNENLEEYGEHKCEGCIDNELESQYQNHIDRAVEGEKYDFRKNRLI